MTSLLFQSAGKGSSSSSSSSSNSFQALAHFYEQELTENHIDARLSSSSTSRHSRQQQQQQQNHQTKCHHLFPSSSSSKDTFTQRGISDTDHGYQSFSNSISPPHSTLTNGHANADISEYLKQRQEYYLREANLRSRDRNDGLGPIVDFSLLAKSRELGDRLSVNHYNHAHRDHTHVHLQKQREATTQQEQVWLDITRAESLKKDKADWNSLWSQGASNSTTIPNSSSMVSSFVDAAVALPSSWPLAPWAIETQAAIMEFEAIYKDYGPQSRPIAHALVDGLPIRSTATSWADEFSKAQTYIPDEGAQAEDHKRKVQSPSQERRGSVKTCGFMFDTKHQGLLSEEAFMTSQGSTSTLMSTPTMKISKEPATACNDDVFEGDMMTAWMETLEQEAREANERNREPTPVPEVPTVVPPAPAIAPVPEPLSESPFEDDMMQAWMNTLEQEKQEADERIQEEEEKIAGSMLYPLSPAPPKEVHNDDVFESDMTSSWMTVLEQEKREADERIREQEEVKKQDSVDPIKDKVILDMALRRLNALMHQLDHGQKSRLGLGRADQATTSMLS
ncbi:MAG: hypothetical protein BYD32DRAFT_430583 [Podila humilis]|nr:MAG: hypothetical protein BYD32DRAFT_430583 [Podila humilis]